MATGVVASADQSAAAITGLPAYSTVAVAPRTARRADFTAATAAASTVVVVSMAAVVSTAAVAIAKTI
jgi:hypothetical protein